jgi:phage baseplate assembly protein W
MNFDFPFHFDAHGRTATAGDDDHVRDMVEQLLFTSPGERLNRPDFGSGLMQLVFAPNSPELAAALQFAVQAALQRWLGDIVDFQEVTVINENAILRVTVVYAVRATGERRSETFERRVA